MATTTENFGLIKPAQGDYYDVDVTNANTAIVETELTKAENHRNNADIHVTVADKTNWNAASGDKHIHNNKSLLDILTQTLIDGWNTAVQKMHEHTNKSVIDGITSTLISRWNTAFSHTSTTDNPHSVTAEQVGADPSGSASAVQANLNTHTGNTTVHITASERTGWNGKAAAKSYTATLTAEGWSGTTAPYTQTASVAGIAEGDQPQIGPVYSATLATALLQQEAWNMVSKAVTAANSITFTCFTDKPATAIPVQIKVVK